MSLPVAVDAFALVGKALPRIFTSTRPHLRPKSRAPDLRRGILQCSPWRPESMPMRPRLREQVHGAAKDGY